MRVSYNWLREYVPVESSTDELADTFADLGLEVDGIDRIGAGLDAVVVARVLEVRPHPDADRIRLVDVDAGDGSALQVCCGADNMVAGDLVPLATVGAVMPGGMEIVARRMRGEMSNGMLCSASELQLGDDGGGILILPPDLPIGTPLAEALGIEADVVFDLDVLPNRPDALSMVGIARDLAARLRLPLELPSAHVVESGAPVDDLASVEILDPVLCGRFVARVLSGVRMGPSPQWLAQRLLSAGMRPINNVVDVSNYVMLELGQPNHTFDLAKVAGGRLRVRRARAGETIETLDGVVRTLDVADGVIADGEDRAIGIAGVMGGAATEIGDGTVDVLLEMAWWDPMSVAVTSARLNLHSEASLRFKRGADPEIAPPAAARFAELLGEVAGAALHPGIVDERGDLPASLPVEVRTDRVNLVLGTSLGRDEIAGLLEPIGFGCRVEGDDLEVAIPSWRYDAQAEIDVIEEVGRTFGLSRITKTVPRSPQGGALSPAQRGRRALRGAMVGAGLCEAMPLPFLAPGDLERCGLPPQGAVLANPLVSEESVLRNTQRPGLLEAVAYNAARRRPGAWLFEIGRVFGPGEMVVDTERSARLGVVMTGERELLGAALAGCDATAAVELLEVALAALGAAPLVLRAEELDGLHPGRGAAVEVAGLEVGVVGEIDPAVTRAVEIEERVAWLELDLSTLLRMPVVPPRAQALSRFPSTDVDFAFVVDEVVPAAAVATTVRAAGGEMVQAVDLFDVFRSESLGEGRRSLAFRVRFQAGDRTLTDGEVAQLRAAIISEVEGTHGAALRG
jgi:phenylalanyl-tRNA synthetase beta chain